MTYVKDNFLQEIKFVLPSSFLSEFENVFLKKFPSISFSLPTLLPIDWSMAVGKLTWAGAVAGSLHLIHSQTAERVRANEDSMRFLKSPNPSLVTQLLE